MQNVTLEPHRQFPLKWVFELACWKYCSIILHLVSWCAYQGHHRTPCEGLTKSYEKCVCDAPRTRQFGHLSRVSGIPEMSLGHPATKQKLRFGHPLVKCHLFAWRFAVIYTKYSVVWTKIRIKWPNAASITHWRRVTTTKSPLESSYRARPPPYWDALN